MQEVLPAAVRGMSLEDVPTVMEIDRLSFPVPWPERSYRYELTENRAATMLVAEHVENRSVVGYLGFWLIADEAHISTLAVHPLHRRRGIGEQLLREALQMAIAKGAEIVTLEVRASNQAALELYEKFDFEVVGKRAGYYRDNREDAILMTLRDTWRWNGRAINRSEPGRRSEGR